MKKVYFGKSVQITSSTELIDNDMSNMFNNNSQIEYVYNIPYSVKTMTKTFLNCTKLINVGKLPSLLESANYTFKGCSIFNQKLENLGFIDLKKLKSCQYIFSDNSQRGGIVSFPESVEDASYSFYATAIKKIKFDINKKYNVTNLERAFSNCSNLESCNLIPSTVSNLNYCFFSSKINSLPQFFLSTTCEMSHTFENTQLKIINRDLPYSRKMDYCFSNINTLEEVSAKHFHLVKENPENNTIKWLFYNCSKLQNWFDVLENVGNCDSAFQKCSKLTSLSLTGVNSCQNFIRANDNTDTVITSIDKITNLSIEGRIVICGGSFFEKYKTLGNFLNSPNTDDTTYYKKIDNLIQLLKNLNGGTNVEVHISGADAPVSAMILQEMDDTVSKKENNYKLYLSSFDLNDYQYKIENGNMILIGINDSFKGKENITFPSTYWLNNTLYSIIPELKLFSNKELIRVSSSLSKLYHSMFENVSNLKEFIFLKTAATEKITEIPSYCFNNCLNVQIFNLENLPLTTIGEYAFYNAINQNIEFNLSNSISVNNQAFYNVNKNNKYEILLNFMKSDNSDPYQLVKFRSPRDSDYGYDVSLSTFNNLKTFFINEFKLDLDNNLKILIKINNFNDFKEQFYDKVAHYFISKKNSSTIIYSRDNNHTLLDFEDCDKIYFCSQSPWNNGWTNLYWTVFKGVD